MVEYRLRIAGRLTDIAVKPDDRYPNMWRIHQSGQVSDMVNLARAKDAAINWFTAARPVRRGLTKGEVVSWDVRDASPDHAPVS